MRIFKSAKINNLVCQFFVTFILVIFTASIGNCFAMLEKEDTISNLSFSHDGKSVVFDRCQNEGCQIQVYNLETGELVAYQSPKNERWTMGKYSYKGKKITFSVIPVKFTGGLDLGEMQIAVMDADGKNYKKVTTGPGAKLYPTFSHNGKKILYTCAARIRESGKTPAAQYDAWEIDLTTGKQTQLTFFKYFYMNNLTYFPDDERFIYYGELPDEFEGLRSYPHAEAFKQKMIELGRKGMNIINVVVMKGKEMIPNPYHFPPESYPHKPLLSKDGSILLYEKSESGKFYLYLPDGNHRLAVHAGPTVSVAISPDGKLIAVIPASSTTLHTYNVSDGKGQHNFYLAYALKLMKNYEDSIKKYERSHGEKFIMLPEQPSMILNQ